MELTKRQEEGLKIAVERYRHREPYTVIAGYAGVGKSTLINFIVSALDLNPENDVAYISFTGKASEVLRSKGCHNAMTAHKLLYYSKQMPNGKFLYRPRSFIGNYKLIVVDEVSMLPKNMWDLLLSHKIHVIACGDPFQIPPVDKNQDNHILDKPHIFLDEVMRQAKESDIICLSMDIRAGKLIRPLKGNDVQVFRKKNSCEGMCYWANQIITSTNKTRHNINAYIRDRLNRSSERPEKEDKVICLQNSWNICSNNLHNPLINGSIGYLKNFDLEYNVYWINRECFEVPIIKADIKTEDDEFVNVSIDYTALTTGEKFFTPVQEYKIVKNSRNPSLPIEFNYGYAITAHRAQGSEWPKVLVMEESYPREKYEHSRWLYTAITRASERLTLILKN